MNADDDWELSPERAHPAARTVLAESFYWSPIDDHAPFGNDMGSDVLSFYRRWRAEYPTAPILHFLRDCLWPSELLDDQEGESVFEILLQSMHGNPQKILRHDQALIALTFGQLVIEGCIDPMLKAHALRALARQARPDALDLWVDECHVERVERLMAMSHKLEQL